MRDFEEQKEATFDKCGRVFFADLAEVSGQELAAVDYSYKTSEKWRQGMFYFPQMSGLTSNV